MRTGKYLDGRMVNSKNILKRWEFVKNDNTMKRN